MGGLPPNSKTPGGTSHNNFFSSPQFTKAWVEGHSPGTLKKHGLDKHPDFIDAKDAKKTSGEAKVRKETLKNTPDKKIIKRGKDYRSRITSRIQNSGVTKRNKASRPELGSRVAALLKPKKSSTKKGDKLG
jgi:hypothetical protein